MDLSILIVSYNTRELTLACVASVYEQTRDVSFEVIVVDNRSGDGSAEAVEEKFPHVRLIRPDENLGFARANNVAAREARGERVLLLNPDTLILDQAIDKAVAFARSREQTPAPDENAVGATVVGGRTFFGDGRLNYNSCHGAPTPWSLVCMGLGLSAALRRSKLFNPEGLGAWQRDTVREVDVITGCFLLMPRRLWERLGGFDESFFMYGEDTDLCLRARRLGARCWVCPEARLVHYGGQSEKVRADKMVRLFAAKVQLFRKHWRPAHVVFGTKMLSLWAFTRMAAWRGIALARRGAAQREKYQTWREVWRRRGEFSAPPAPPPATSPATAPPPAPAQAGVPRSAATRPA